MPPSPDDLPSTDTFESPPLPPAPGDVPPAGGYALAIVFTGSGSEYLRIWIVNLLLTLVTFGIYYPWAKVRRLRYFYGNTLVGEHPLDFHGDPKRMLRGYALITLLLVLYSNAGRFSPMAGMVAFLILAAVWPALFRASQQFRLANTSWRGLRFRFTGDMAGAYRTMLPLFVPVLALVLLDMAASGAPPSATKMPSAWIIASTFAPLLFVPLQWWLLKKFQHDHYAIGQATTEFPTGPGSFYAVFARTAGVSLLVGLCGGLLGLIVAGGSMVALLGGKLSFDSTAVMAAFAFAVLALYIAMALAIGPYATSRLQNLVWNRTKSTELRFESSLRFWPLLRLTLKNWLLMLLTLGMYWPFAKVATTRLRLQAVTVFTRIAPDELVSRTLAGAADATGDAAGDMFGIDIGL